MPKESGWWKTLKGGEMLTFAEAMQVVEEGGRVLSPEALIVKLNDWDVLSYYDEDEDDFLYFKVDKTDMQSPWAAIKYEDPKPKFKTMTKFFTNYIMDGKLDESKVFSTVKETEYFNSKEDMMNAYGLTSDKCIVSSETKEFPCK